MASWYDEYELRGRVDGFCERVCTWRLRVYDDETMLMVLEPCTTSGRGVEGEKSSQDDVDLVVYDGQAGSSTRSRLRGQDVVIARFRMAQTSVNGESWSVVCKARLEMGSDVMNGTWSHANATPHWTASSVQGVEDRVHQPFALTVVNAKPRSGCVRVLSPFQPGRYDFQMVLVDEVKFSVWRYWLTLVVDEKLNRLRGEMQWRERAVSVLGMWKGDTCEWVTDEGALVQVTVDDVSLLGQSKLQDGSPSGCCECVVKRVAHQWRWEDHESAPRALQIAFTVCQELSCGLDVGIWRRVFEYCDLDWFGAER